MRIRRPRLANLALAFVLVGLSACGAIGTAVCDLLDYGVEIQADLDELLAVDPEEARDAP